MFSTEYRGSFYAILSGFLYGFIGYFGLSVMNAHVSVSNMLFWRFFISSIIMLFILLPHIKHITDSWGNILFAFFLGAALYSFSTMLYFYASQYIGSGLAMVIFFTYPVIVMLFNYFFYGQQMPRIYYLATIIILTGMALFIDMHEIKLDLIGIILGVISAFFYACYIVASKRSSISPNMSALMVSVGVMVTCLLLTWMDHSFFIPTSLSVWGNLIGIGIISTAIPILLLLYSLKYINSEKASILSVLEPVFVVIFGVILLGEELSLQHIAGIIIVLGGALITLFSHKIEINKMQPAND
ncbi:DMT family transporter [Legionella oakridgensis]|uniref:Integral membrane protein n=2 Tax=Legionella oakridgensis TaxID=29423 RepID=A0A0W0X057_9GAMM|nr:DMT family transporter [Legionella oakridgensis]AHE67290.1 putative permease, DMT superfamily [Legionella oakridgensis ATCC 33761 = DSM 21215]ETO93100.1 putative permease, DMT superfamily [Legionella oakridgensis RV-2-2007]KTD37923.1 integral membrane protein [Legionella oakridgensis]STY20356.1 permease, DMT superfamily [Legionella longbeachae]